MVIPQILLNCFLPVILLYLLFQIRALGAGDIKLFSMTGFFLTTEQLIFMILLSFFAGAVIGAVKIVYSRVFCKKQKGTYTIIHFSIPILLSYFVTACVPEQLTHFLHIWGCIFD